MRRHIIPVPAMSFDTRALTLGEEIKPEWEESVKELHRSNHANLLASLSVELGAVDFGRKLQDFKALGVLPFSIVSYHNDFLRQARGAFVQGYYYPALTAACALGERILNHLILDLRDDYKEKKTHKKVADGASFDKWQQAIYVLNDWGVLLPDAAGAFNKLKALRDKSLHFSPSTYVDLRADALRAIDLLSTVITSQFPVLGLQPWFIEGIVGASFIKAEWESNPFVKKFYLPFCPRVGIYCQYAHANGHWKLFDFKSYDDRELTDAEFCAAYNGRDGSRLAPTTEPASSDVICYEWVRRSNPVS